MNANIPPVVDRRTASQILGVSIRTIDRYIRSGKLFAQIEEGRIWLDKREIMNLSRMPRSNFGTPAPTKHPVIAHSTTTEPKIPDKAFFQDLYEEAKKALGEYQQKLEQSNYRIGQLESQILHQDSRPKPIERIERKDDSIAADFLRKELNDKEKELSALKEILKQERTSRIVFSILTYVLLAALPLIWYLLRSL